MFPLNSICEQMNRAAVFELQYTDAPPGAAILWQEAHQVAGVTVHALCHAPDTCGDRVAQASNGCTSGVHNFKLH